MITYFIQFSDRDRVYRVAIISANGTEIKKVPGRSCLNQQGEPVFWFKPEDKARRDGWDVLKRYEYQVEGDKARLLQVQDFDFTWQVYDFDPETNSMLVRSWDTMFPHGWLVNVITGDRKRLRLHGDPLFLRDEVIDQFEKAARRH